jgi:hypothetical protein
MTPENIEAYTYLLTELQKDLDLIKSDTDLELSKSMFALTAYNLADLVESNTFSIDYADICQARADKFTEHMRLHPYSKPVSSHAA